jgi:hypothetical protein
MKRDVWRYNPYLIVVKAANRCIMQGEAKGWELCMRVLTRLRQKK